MSCFSGGTLDIYVEPQKPKPRLVIVGHLPVARALAHLGRAMSYRTIGVDPDGTLTDHVDETVSDLKAIPQHVDASTFVIVASHGHYDEEALQRVLATAAPYVGLVASRKRAAPILEILRQKGFGEDELARIKAPAGLDIGARRGDEIALSIMAEIVGIRRSAERVEWTPEEDSEEGAGAADGESGTEATAAVDPICGMTVQARDARHTYEHQGTVFYFCCAGCKEKFAAAPEQHLAGEARSRLSLHPA